MADELFERVRLRCLTLPESTLRSDPFAHAFQIRRNIFAHLLAPDDAAGRPVPMIVVRADPTEREVLMAIGHPYFGTRSGPDRIGVILDEHTDWDEIGELITESYRILAPKKLAALLDR